MLYTNTSSYTTATRRIEISIHFRTKSKIVANLLFLFNYYCFFFFECIVRTKSYTKIDKKTAKIIEAPIATQITKMRISLVSGERWDVGLCLLGCMQSALVMYCCIFGPLSLASVMFSVHSYYLTVLFLFLLRLLLLLVCLNCVY